MQDGVYVVNKDFDIEYVNPVLTKDFGDYEGKKCYKYFHNLDEVCPWCKNDNIQKGHSVHWEWYSDKNGKTYDLLDTPIYNADGTISKLEIFRDITENKLIEEKLKFSQEYFQSIFDVTPNIMITTNGEEIERVNSAMLDFFGFKTVDDFKSKYSCICDFFIEGDDWVQPDMDGTRWLDYILKNQDKLHKVSMLKDKKQYHFIVWAKLLKVDKEHRSVVVFTDISELEKISERLEFATNGTNDGLWDWDLLTNEVYYSPKWKEILGYRDEELQNIFETWETRVHPDDIVNMSKNIKLSHNNPKINFKHTFRLQHKDGHWVWILVRAKTIFNEEGKAVRMAGFHTDISEQKELEFKLRASQLEFDLFMHFIPAKILIKEQDGTVIYSNDAANSFFNKESLVGKKTENLLPPKEAKNTNKFDSNVLKYGKYEELSEFYNQNGEKVIIRTLGFKIEMKESLQIGLVLLDITQSYLDKEELKNKEEIMIAQSRHAAMGEMISMIAHQWRQPISVIAMDANNILADIELDMIDEEQLKNGSQDIIKQTQELSKTIDDFRNFFRPGRVSEELLVQDILQEALGVIGKSLSNNNIEVILELGEAQKVKTYSRELMQVLINIIKNAKEVLLENDIEDKKISIYIKKQDENLTITICDNGGGVKEENMEKIFDPYFTTKGEKNGTGLGLYMSRTIVEKHLEGSLSVFNDDEGACFKITIPHALKDKEKEK
ncbi:MAG: PAS domain S-box protein, partial [Sulfurimonas sp.]|nr:PAS domain S-box protein [Sulfurimonas sp.]